ncbi:MAG: hypothetical protein KA715_10795 [Xanthomonadaceae bacterium]|nr:hypothetical protein [Xanthomonadaceae bacterium]
MSQLEITGMILGGLLSVVFVGYLILAETGAKKGRRRYNGPQRFAGGFSFLLGVLMFGAWTYFVIDGRESLMRSFGFLFTHVALELVSSLALIIGGLAMFRGLFRAPALMMTAYAIVIFTQVLSVSIYGPIGHPFLMNGIALILLVVLIYFVGLVYAWEHFVLRLDQPEPTQSKPSRT